MPRKSIRGKITLSSIWMNEFQLGGNLNQVLWGFLTWLLLQKFSTLIVPESYFFFSIFFSIFFKRLSICM